MLADRTLLFTTLVATAGAGFTTGWAARERKGDPDYRPLDARHVYADRLEALRAKGYDDAEMQEAVRAHQQLLDGYNLWWNRFLDEHDRNVTKIDSIFEGDMEKLELRFRQRTGGAEAK